MSVIKTNERYTRFEHELRYLLRELKDPLTIEDMLYYDDIKHCIMVFAIKDQFGEDNNVFLHNIKHDFYSAIEKLEEAHSDINCEFIKSFVEDYFFNTQEKMYSWRALVGNTCIADGYLMAKSWEDATERLKYVPFHDKHETVELDTTDCGCNGIVFNDDGVAIRWED